MDENEKNKNNVIDETIDNSSGSSSEEKNKKPLPWQKHLFEGLDPDDENGLQDAQDQNMSDDEYSWSQDLYAALSKYRKNKGQEKTADASLTEDTKEAGTKSTESDKKAEAEPKEDGKNAEELEESNKKAEVGPEEESKKAEVGPEEESKKAEAEAEESDKKPEAEPKENNEEALTEPVEDGNGASIEEKEILSLEEQSEPVATDFFEEIKKSQEAAFEKTISNENDDISAAGEETKAEGVTGSVEPEQVVHPEQGDENTDQPIQEIENTDSHEQSNENADQPIQKNENIDSPEQSNENNDQSIQRDGKNVHSESENKNADLSDHEKSKTADSEQENKNSEQHASSGDEKGGSNSRPWHRRNQADRIVTAQEAVRKDRFSGAPEVKKKDTEEQTRTPEEIFNESYTILGEIGSGEGTAYKALDRRSTRQVVIKKVHMQIQNLQEIKPLVEKLKLLDHPSLPKVVDYVMYNGYIYSVMEYIEGRSLYRSMSDGTRFSEKQVKNWAIQIADAMKALHQASPRVIHGDIKPSNIILTSNDKVFLVDFNIGISEENGAHSIGYSDGYAPPEQYDFVSANQYSATGRYDDRFAKTIVTNPDGIYTVQSGFTYDASSRAYAIIDEKSDIYSFGATFYYILTGKMPGSSAGKVTSISDTGVHTSRKFRKLITRCMERSPKKRYQSARALLDALKKKIITIPMVVAAVLFVALVVCGIMFGSKLFEKKKSKPEMLPPSSTIADNTQDLDSSKAESELTVPTEGADVTPELTEGAETTPEPTAGEEITPVPTETITPEPTAVAEITPMPTDGADVTPEPTDGGEMTPVPSDGADATPAPTDGGDITPTATDGTDTTPVPTDGTDVTPEPTDGADMTPIPTEGAENTPVPTEEITPAPTEAVTPVPTEEVTPVPTEEVTPVPTEEVTPVPTEEVTPVPTEEVTPIPTAPAMVIYAENEIGFIYKNGAYETEKVSELSKVDAENIEYVYMGGYPTKRVTDEETIAKLNKTSFKSEGTAMLNGVRYNKVNYQEADGSIKVLYYINEALKWNVLNIEDGVLTLITDRIIDFEPIKKEASSVTWSDSKLKGWLETNFRNTTFTDREKKLLEGNPDMLKESELSLNGVSLRSSCTDYARMGYNFGNAFYDAYAAAEWWLKPESDENLSEYRYVASDGSISDSKVEETERKGVRPVIKIRMSVS